MTPSRRWSPSEINDMRQRLANGETQKEVGESFSISGERVRQLTGNVGRNHPSPKTGWVNHRKKLGEENFKKVTTLFRQGKTDAEIAEATGLGVDTVLKHRIAAGYRKTNKHSAEHNRWCLRLWVQLFEYIPAATDWNATLARKSGIRRITRYREFQAAFGCPGLKVILKTHGSWANFLESVGFARSKEVRKLPWKTAPLLSELAPEMIQSALDVVGPEPEV